MRILVMGGTQFVGRHFVEAALSRGHELTLFHRGRTGAGLFPQAEHVLGDRLESLAPLEGRTWDALVDVSAYVPRAVRMAAESLADRVGYSLQVSTISVYDRSASPIDEDSPHATLDDQTTETVDGATYGGLKSLCETEGRRGFPRIGFVRPTYVVGPFDHTERFPYWVDRLGRGEAVEVPRRADGSAGRLQFIDGRDLADFMVTLVETSATGAWNAVAPSLPFLQALERMKLALGSASEIREGGDAEKLPLLAPLDGSGDAFMDISNARATAAGLRIRPFEETVRDTWDWWRGEGRRTKFDQQ